jgi:hypothetical protein
MKSIKYIYLTCCSIVYFFDNPRANSCKDTSMHDSVETVVVFTL